MLVMNIDARTFHGVPLVYARFNLDTYSFDRVPEEEIAAAKASKKEAENNAWITKIWKSKALDYAASYADAESSWNISRQGSSARFKKLIAADLVERINTQRGNPVFHKLSPKGAEVLKETLKLHPTCIP